MSMTKLNKEQVRSQLQTLQYDIQRLSDKKPNDTINEFKLKFINLKADIKIVLKILVMLSLQHIPKF